MSTGFDHAIMRAIGEVRSPPLTAVARGLTVLGSVSGVTVVALGAVLLARGRRRSQIQIAAGALGGIGSELLKPLFARSRPRLLPHLERVSSPSFPSGHAMAAASMMLTLGLVRPRPRGRGVLASLALAAAVAGSRVVLGVHWPTDVLAGLALGSAWALSVDHVVGRSVARPSPRDRRCPGLRALRHEPR